jgi:hypothetical protein
MVWCVIAGLSIMTPAARALPDGRSYELVSPPDKNGGYILPDAQSTRAAADGGAVQFASLTAFGDAVGTGVNTDYVSMRSVPGAGNVGNGWSTHAITPPEVGGTYATLFAFLEPSYLGEFTADLSAGVFLSPSPLTDDPNTAAISNLYLRTDLKTGGAGAYQLTTLCPLCEATATPLSLPVDGNAALAAEPFLAAISPDAGHVAFESRVRLTADTPLAAIRVETYEWDHGAVRLVGRIPSGSSVECDDVSGPACVASSFSIAGPGAGTTGNSPRVPHGVSDGSDGHTRIFFTRPTKADGSTLDPAATAGRLYMRVDGTTTVQLNASERTSLDAAAAAYLDASADGQRVFFETVAALTDNAPVGASNKIYMYDASKPASAPDNLTLLSVDGEAGDGLGGSTAGFIGASADGRYAYFMADGQLVSGAPLSGSGIYVWHDGTLAYVGPAPPSGKSRADQLSTAGSTSPQARVTPDGRFLLFSTTIGTGLVGYDHNSHSELYLYSADSAELSCVSCNPSGAPATADASDSIRTLYGGTRTSWHRSHAIADDGSRVFFSTGDPLVPEDTNGRSDAYEYDVATRTPHLISAGKGTSDSWFMDAGTDGRDVFFLTAERLVGWDGDGAYDLYDARVGGGFPEPVQLPACSGDACRGTATSSPAAALAASGTFTGAGNVRGRPSRHRTACRRGFVRKRVRGSARCVRRAKHGRRRHRRRHARSRAGTRG